MRSIHQVTKIVKESMDITFKELNFVEIEILFRLCERLNINYDVNKFYTLLSGSHLIYEKDFGREDYYLSNAKILLKTLNHSKVYKDVLKEYCLPNNSLYAIYCVEDNILKRNQKVPQVYENRTDDYDALIDFGNPPVESKTQFSIGNEIYAAYISDSKIVNIKFESLRKKEKVYPARNAIGGSIKISIDEVLKGSDKIDKVTCCNYRRNVIQNNIYYSGYGTKDIVKEIEIDGVINLAGQVAAGKTTFSESLSVALLYKGYRVVIIQPTVDQVIQQAELFEKMNYHVCTLIGNSGRCKHTDNQMKGKNFLPEYYSQVLQEPCILNSLIDDISDVFKFGQEPCNKLYKYDGNEINFEKKYICQYYDFCPRTRNDRMIKSSDILITTLEGYCMSSFGADRKNFMTYAIENFDLVIMDEVDNILCKLDSIFAPVLAVNEYLNKNLPYRVNYKKKSLNAKIQTSQSEREVLSKLEQFERMMVEISEEIRESNTGWDESNLKNFTALSLLNKIAQDEENSDEVNRRNRLPIEICQETYKLMQPPLFDEQLELLNLIKGGECNLALIFNRLIQAYAKDDKEMEFKIRKKCDQLSPKTLKRLFFILKIIGFEQVYRDLSRIVESSVEIPMEVKDILNRNLKIQQQIIPNAPIGNTLAIEVKEKDMYIKKQFAFGRSLALKMPMLKLDAEGRNIGAKVLLMSGTGYMPGSFRHHVSDKVDYIIEAEKQKREFISKTKVINLHSTNCVSGAKERDKNIQLKRLVTENEKSLVKCVSNDETILVIVNKYDQCAIVAKAIDNILIKNKINCEASYLLPDGRKYQNGNIIYRSEVTKFNNKILVAPACVIERGYNIVDSLGNAKFDTVMFFVRPMTDPDDYAIHVQKVNGYIMNKYNGFPYENRIEIVEKMRTDAFNMYFLLSRSKGRLSDLPKDLQIDAIASLFVVIEQVFGRLCRIGSKQKEKYPTIYWVDGAFNSKKPNDFDTLKELKRYLYELINKSSNPIVAKTLYEPLFLALKGDS